MLRQHCGAGGSGGLGLEGRSPVRRAGHSHRVVVSTRRHVGTSAARRTHRTFEVHEKPYHLVVTPHGQSPLSGVTPRGGDVTVNVSPERRGHRTDAGGRPDVPRPHDRRQLAGARRPTRRRRRPSLLGGDRTRPRRAPHRR
ncbi:protein of unknown function [Modestobacter italicus]|uniref:Uncharacterized protein n=1 Tax=Modestobacter italicus (strain DSM 44449 / CECT 9708 / BC 501) TaxID=2732864 RepID=I4EYS3_MODI5|nr:protein of unknown function [Modestobacter marinus]